MLFTALQKLDAEALLIAANASPSQKRMPRSRRSSDAKSDTSADTEILMELDDSNLELVPSLCRDTRLVFRLAHCLGDASIGLGRINVMFRGEDSNLLQTLERVYLVLRKETRQDTDLTDTDDFQNPLTAVIGEADVDPDMDDLRVLLFPQWTSKVPLPLGNALQNHLFLYIYTKTTMDPSRIKFGADVVSTPDVYRKNRMKRQLKSSLMRVEYGCVKALDTPRLAEFVEETYATGSLVLPEPVATRDQKHTESRSDREQQKSNAAKPVANPEETRQDTVPSLWVQRSLQISTITASTLPLARKRIPLGTYEE